jgi:hypothetical protein
MMALTEEQQRRVHFIDTLAVNVDNKQLTDSEFRTFVRNSLKQFNIKDKPSSGSGSGYVGPYGDGPSQDDR